MPTIDSGRLESTATRIFEGLGAPPGDAAWIAHLSSSPTCAGTIPTASSASRNTRTE
jgi:hypothetical protein